MSRLDERRLEQELLARYGKRTIRSLVATDGPVAQFIFDRMAPGEYDSAEWQIVLDAADRNRTRLADWLADMETS